MNKHTRNSKLLAIFVLNCFIYFSNNVTWLHICLSKLPHLWLVCLQNYKQLVENQRNNMVKYPKLAIPVKYLATTSIKFHNEWPQPSVKTMEKRLPLRNNKRTVTFSYIILNITTLEYNNPVYTVVYHVRWHLVQCWPVIITPPRVHDIGRYQLAAPASIHRVPGHS